MPKVDDLRDRVDLSSVEVEILGVKRSYLKRIMGITGRRRPYKARASTKAPRIVPSVARLGPSMGRLHAIAHMFWRGPLGTSHPRHFKSPQLKDNLERSSGEPQGVWLTVCLQENKARALAKPPITQKVRNQYHNLGPRT